ncbi:hypothetical protein VTJ83DRAFT_4428 [Remersonia thermophila]|uniref:Uncharacterized protein n=1 Tax=Remersonia thermophila TaxID=72144 RepID=A0ABR4D9Y6_9PEZI
MLNYFGELEGGVWLHRAPAASWTSRNGLRGWRSKSQGHLRPCNPGFCAMGTWLAWRWWLGVNHLDGRAETIVQDALDLAKHAMAIRA